MTLAAVGEGLDLAPEGLAIAATGEKIGEPRDEVAVTPEEHLGALVAGQAPAPAAAAGSGLGPAGAAYSQIA